MNTWQPIETAPLNQPVLVTDGKSVWFGRFKSNTEFEGTDSDGEYFWCSWNSDPKFQCELTGWQPAPDTFTQTFATAKPELTVNNVTMRSNGDHGMAFTFDADNNVATKTADEMLSDLGFKKNTSVCYGEDKGVLLYEKSVQDGADVFEIYFENGKVRYSEASTFRCIWMTYDLVAAIAKKLEEMGWDK